MFSWNIAKSAEAVFSRWAVKRLCKFVFKKKLGQFILGDIDLNQLDVQLGQGTIHLSDLALNVDYLNQKLDAAASVIVKEGSIGSLTVKMPWKCKGFQVEVDELEIVLAPCLRNSSTGNQCCSVGQNSNHHVQNDERKPGNGIVDNDTKSNSADVHEGVKTIAKMVKWFLTSFHINVKKLIVAFEPYLDSEEKKVGLPKTLVLRISEIECGTCVSEDADPNPAAIVESFLGISQLTNFIKFEGAVVELLRMDNDDNQSCSLCESGPTPDELILGKCPSPANSRTPILAGKKGGFSGNFRLSIPWRNGSLDVQKLDAEVRIDPVELRFQPSTMRWFLTSWDTYKNVAENGTSSMHCKSMNSVYLDSVSHFHSRMSVPWMGMADELITARGSSAPSSSRFTAQESASEAMVPGSHLIPDWVPKSVQTNETDCIEEELDLGASMDQFFECFDGMRNSQSALGSSGMWNWTCSVFTALTAASSLASGSVHIPSEQHHVQTNFRATLAGISIMLSFKDEDLEQLCASKGDQTDSYLSLHFLVAECKDISAVLQVCPTKTSFEGQVKCIEVADYWCDQNDAMNCDFQERSSDSNCQSHLIKLLQDDVQGALPFLASAAKVPDSLELGAVGAFDSSFRNVNKVKLLSTSGVTRCQFNMCSDKADERLTWSTSFALQLPQFIFWVNFSLIDAFMDLMKDVCNSIDLSGVRNGFPSASDNGGASDAHVKNGKQQNVGTSSSTGNLRGDISIPNGRIILCFPLEMRKDVEGFSSWRQFVAIDFASPSTLEKVKAQGTNQILDSISQKPYTSRGTFSLRLNMGGLQIHLVNPTCNSDLEISSSGVPRQKFSAQKIVSVMNTAGHLSSITMLWQDGALTGSWMAERAKSLATSGESRNEEKHMEKDFEFATVTAIKDLEDRNSQTREQMILSAAFFLHVHLFCVRIDLGIAEYRKLVCLLDQTVKGLSSMASGAGSESETSSVSQTSVLVECESVEIIIRPEIKEDIKSSLQNELPGSWHCLKLKVKKFDLLSVPNIGGIRGAKFFWLAHGEGGLWGSITGVPDHEFLLISCSNSARKRGDGGGSNALSSMLAGSDIVHLSDPESFNCFTSITVRCGTIVAVGGRLDWVGSITGFFSSSQSSEVEIAEGDTLPKGDKDLPCETSFFLKLVDIGLSYEPHLKNSLPRNLHSESSSHCNEETGEPYVACLLAASSLALTNTTIGDSMANDYNIKAKDLGLLLCPANDSLGGSFGVERLCEIGYIKVAREALVEAVLRTNCKNGLMWEIESSKSHIFVETCNDTTSGLMRLASQLQQLFAPDLEESLVHLQNRWNNVHWAQEGSKFSEEGKTGAPSTPHLHAAGIGANSTLEVVSLMDEICEDAFHLDRHPVRKLGFDESQVHVSFDENVLGEPCSPSVDTPDAFVDDLFNGSVPIVELESSQTSFLQEGSFPEFIEGYWLSDLGPLTEVSLGRKRSHEINRCEYEDGDQGRENTGWYQDASLRIVDDHISEASTEAGMSQFLEDKPQSINAELSDDWGRVLGRVLLENFNVIWRIYGGSDWNVKKGTGEASKNICGRDSTACLELELHGMQFQYDWYPIVGICASKLSFSVQDFYLYDTSKTAPWKLVLGYYNSKDHPRESSSKAFKLDLEAVRPDPLIPLEEYRLRVAFLPMLLHLHQSQLDFLIGFFGSESSSADQSFNHDQNLGSSKPYGSKSNNSLTEHEIADKALLPYFQKFDIWPILLRVDYIPSCVDLAALCGGKYVELVNLVAWKGVELQLKHVQAVGICGWGSVCETIIGEWLEDISQNQIHKVLRGLPTVRSFVAVGAGAKKLVSLPVESYRKDQRVLKGVQRGTIAFLRSISVEAVGLGVHLAAGVNDILLQAEYILTSTPPSVSLPVQGKTKPNVRCNQPKDAREGIQQAYRSLSDGLGKSASALVRTPLKKYQRGASAGSAFATAVRSVPAAAIAPVTACASAAHYTLLGLRNSLDPDHKKESMEKYLGPTQPRNWN